MKVDQRSAISFITIGLGVVLLILASSCQTVSTTHTQLIGVPKYPPSDPAGIEILRAEPTRPHVRLGEVKAEPSDEKMDAARIEEALCQEPETMDKNHLRRRKIWRQQKS